MTNGFWPRFVSALAGDPFRVPDAELLAEAGQEAADLKQRLGYLVEEYQTLLAATRDSTAAGAVIAVRLENSPLGRMDLTGLLGVAVSMLAERPQGGEH